MFKVADNRNPHSLAFELRLRRMRCLFNLLRIDESTRILDLGGTAELWDNAEISGDITILNIFPDLGASSGGFHYIRGDACDLSNYRDAEFDVVFSNSVIEHVGGWENQRAMAREVRRVGKSYFIQGPNRNFPIEPHFLFPAFQFLPTLARRFIARHWSYGWYKSGSTSALHDAEHIRMLTCSELSELFPDGFILGESF